jgi:hypothetical protein
MLLGLAAILYERHPIPGKPKFHESTGGKIQTPWFVTDFRLGRGVLVDEWK